MTQLAIKILDKAKDLDLPAYATIDSAGMDLRAVNDDVLKKGQWKLVDTGVCIALPRGKEAQIRPRSGLAYKHGVTVLNSPGTIDADYRGEVKVLLINHGNEDFIIQKNMRIAQMIIADYSKVELDIVTDLPDTVRGEGGFGSTGVGKIDSVA